MKKTTKIDTHFLMVILSWGWESEEADGGFSCCCCCCCCCWIKCWCRSLEPSSEAEGAEVDSSAPAVDDAPAANDAPAVNEPAAADVAVASFVFRSTAMSLTSSNVPWSGGTRPPVRRSASRSASPEERPVERASTGASAKERPVERASTGAPAFRKAT